MAAELTTAMAWALASKVALIDARHGEPQEAAAKRAESAALLDRARKVDDDVCLLMRADDYMRGQVKPSSHYATPMTAAQLKRVYSLRAAMNRKPTRRSGTKPSSLPNRLAAACHTLKEP